MRGRFLVFLLPIWVVLACSKSADEAATDAATDAPPPVVDAAPAADAAPPEASRGALEKLGATAQTSVFDSPSKDSKRLGYLRHGAVVMGYANTSSGSNDDCKDGWYELESGGYVCGGRVSSDVTSPKVRLAPKQPDLDAGMPYKYGVNLQDGTPLYRKVLATDDRKKYEPYLTPKEKEEKKDDTTDSPEAAKIEPTEGDESKKDKDPKDAGVDASKPTLKSLKGHGPVARTMAKGFYLALDRSFTSNGSRWWRTTFGLAVPYDRIMVQPGVTKYSGTWFEGITAPPETDGGDEDASDAGNTITPGTVAFVTVGFARKLDLSDDEKSMKWGAELPKRSAVLLDGKSATVQGTTYHHTTSGFWVRLMDLTLAHPQPPADIGPTEKWIDVDLTRQALVAFEGMKPVFGTLISSGKRNPQDKEKDFPTPTGNFRIREKHVTTTMDGDVASDGPYSIEDVPWVMYFQGSYALHGAFWHDQFGNKRSHGCVNMAPEDARTVFAWSDPPLPAGWHGVFAKEEKDGTRLVLHEDKRQR